MTTLTQLVDRVASRLSMVSGIGVQVYAEDRIAEMIQHKFDVLFKEAFWPEQCTWAQYTLDGTTGVVTIDLTNLIKHIDDIQVIFPEETEIAITKLSHLTINPFGIRGTTPIHYDALSPTDGNVTSRVFRIWPLTSTGDITIRFRTKPDTFVSNDEIVFDDQVLILGATFDYLEDDGTNPNATQKFERLFESRVKQLLDSLNSGPISLDGNARRQPVFTFTELP